MSESVEMDKKTNFEARIALYRKYRPTKLSDVIGQPQVTDILQAAAEKKSFAHAYLFTGQRGTGKTTVARILAHLINESDYVDNLGDGNVDVDIIEIDAASNNGVDDVREIRDNVQLRPMSGSHKVFIIDEFHMLSKPAFNALLKTIEEPPEYVVFILATTELHKVPATILSRVQRFGFRPVDIDILANHLQSICRQEGIKIDDESLRLIAISGGGSVRDAITLLDQLSNYDEITPDVVRSTLGLPSAQLADQLLRAIQRANANESITLTTAILDDGADAVELASQLIAELSRKVTETPIFYRLIADLLEVGKSSMPRAKLLSAILAYCDKVSPFIVEGIATQNQTAIPKEATKNIQDMDESSRNVSKIAKTDSSDIAKNDDGDNNQVDTMGVIPNLATKTESIEGQEGVDDFSWEDILQQLVDDDMPSTRALLMQSDYRYDGEANIVTLFFARDFHRKRAESQNFQSELLQSIEAVYGVKPIINISKEPLDVDPEIKAVLDIMGGEVTRTNGTI